MSEHIKRSYVVCVILVPACYAEENRLALTVFFSDMVA